MLKLAHGAPTDTPGQAPEPLPGAVHDDPQALPAADTSEGLGWNDIDLKLAKEGFISVHEQQDVVRTFQVQNSKMLAEYLTAVGAIVAKPPEK